MNFNAVEIAEKIRQQFNTGPFPRIAIETSPKNIANSLYVHNLATPYYLRNQKVVDTKGKVILDAGCGTGYKSLVLAEANPGAKIVGVDISDKSVELAKQRLQYHGFDNAEFYAVSIEDLPQLGLSFDYINCDEVLYLLPNPILGLQAMQAVLQPEGIIRANLHSSYGRANIYRAQKIFKLMGLMDNNPGELEIGIVREILVALKEQVQIKARTWMPAMETDDEKILANYLLQGDKGSTVPEMFSALKAANLEFISMVYWRQWDLTTLFKEPDNLPSVLALSVPETSIEEKLYLFELFNPVFRLLDFWCGHPHQNQPFVPVTEWSHSDWQAVQVHLHPQLQLPAIKAELIKCIDKLQPFEIGQHLRMTENITVVESNTAACLFPLWEAPQSAKSLVERWQQLRPLDPLTLKPTTPEEAWTVVIQSLTELESMGYLFLERTNQLN